MSIDKNLQKIQQQINELAPMLELFVDESVQPSVKDCGQLQDLLVKLQEHLAVYKYHKQERELSPSFNIHAKVSEKSEEQKARDAIKTEILQNDLSPVNESGKNENTPLGDPLQLPPLSFNINDKFRFVNELFKQNMSEYNIVMEQINSMNSWSDSELYLNSLKMIYGWKDNSEVLLLFYSQVKKRFL